MPTYRSSSLGTGAATALPSGLATGDILLAIVSVEVSGATINNTDAAVWTSIGAVTNVGAAGAMSGAAFWARKTAGNLGSAPTWTASSGTPAVGYSCYSAGTSSGSPFDTGSGVGFLISHGSDSTAEFGSITPVVDSCLIVGLQAVFTWANSTSTDFATERADGAAAGPHSVWEDGTLAPAAATGTLVVNNGGVWFAVLLALEPDDTSSKEQEGYRFRDDDGSETTATWLASQDANITRALSTNTRLRLLLNIASGDPPNQQFEVRYKKSTDSVWLLVPTSSALSVSYVGTGAASSGTATSSAAPGYPSGMVAGDLMLLSVASRLGSTSVDTPSGWTALATENVATSEGTAGGEGADAGGVRISTFSKEATGSESGTLTVSNAGTATLSVSASISAYRKPEWATWSIASTTGKDVAGGTSYSAAMGSDPGIDVADIVFCATAVNTDAAAWSAEAVTGTGITTALTAERAEGSSSGGNDLELITSEYSVSAGPSSAAPTFTATASTGTPEGATVLIRVRATGAPAIIMAASANIAASGANTTAQLTAPSGKTTSDFVAGRIQDDENPADAVDITSVDYTELEWCLQAQSPATNGDIYQFRLYKSGGTAVDTYTVTPEWTIGSGGGAPTSAEQAGIFAQLESGCVIGRVDA